MPDCSYCDASFDDDEALLDHLAEAHEGELSRIDRRRVETHRPTGGRSRAVRYGAAALVALLLAGVVYVTVLQGGGGGSAGQALEAQPLPDHGNQTRLAAVQQFPSEGRNHVPAGTQVDYGTSPPTSGPHYDDWTRAGFYDEAPAAGNLVHSLEHGYVVVYYDPDALTPGAEDSLKAFATAHDARWESVVVVPRANANSPYVLTAWRTMLRLDTYDAETVRAFLAEYLGRGPEHPVR